MIIKTITRTGLEIALCWGLVIACISARAQINEIPLEELPSESVIPIFDSPKAVINRLVTFQKKIELNSGIGFLLDEPFYQNSFGNFAALYNLDETHGFGLRYMMFMTGVSDNGK